MAGVRSASEAEREAATETLVEAIVKEIEPLLVQSDKGQGPFFGGSEKLTFAEVSYPLVQDYRKTGFVNNHCQVLTGSFLLRFLAFGKPQHGLLSAKPLAQVKEKAPRFQRWAEATVSQESVNYIWDEQAVVDHTRAKFAPKP